ncbi:MAG TPA: MauE/DoxX family redox-associated membrane protein [Deltaproteobacteria bacterium]|jgi:uncharacterized membrane protein YphA (DoxX/SURF4 family)|nr:MauE/DoxX family redox-associated membrane protein [Deltaproteobacteria bacterium]
MTNATDMGTIVRNPAGKSWFGKVVGNGYLILACRLLLGATFLLSSIGKLVDIEAYSVDAVYNFGVLPLWLARPAGLIMPFIELGIALGLIFGVLTRLSAFGASILSVIFFLVKCHVLFIQGRQIDCGCFGAIMETMASVTIYMDIPMAIMGLLIMLAPVSSRYWVSFARFAPANLMKKLDLVW